MDFDSVLKKRRSVRSYSTKKVTFKDVITACESALSAPAAGNIFAARLVLVADKKRKQELAKAALDQEFIAEAPYIIAVCSDPSELLRSYSERGKIYARQQAGAAIENIFLKITELGLASCWVGAFDENAVKRILGVPDKVQVEALLPVAYARGKLKAKTKPELKYILHFEKWGVKTTKPTRRAMPFKA